MIDRDIVEKGLAALSVAAGELIEDHHDRLISTLPASETERRRLFENLHQLGDDLSAVALAAAVLLNSAEPADANDRAD